MQEKNLLLGTALIVTVLFALGVCVYLSEPITETIPVVNGSTHTGKIYNLPVGQIVEVRGGYKVIYDGEDLSVGLTFDYNSQNRFTLHSISGIGKHFFIGNYEYRYVGFSMGNIGDDYIPFMIIQDVD